MPVFKYGILEHCSQLCYKYNVSRPSRRWYNLARKTPSVLALDVALDISMTIPVPTENSGYQTLPGQCPWISNSSLALLKCTAFFASMILVDFQIFFRHHMSVCQSHLALARLLINRKEKINIGFVNWTHCPLFTVKKTRQLQQLSDVTNFPEISLHAAWVLPLWQLPCLLILKSTSQEHESHADQNNMYWAQVILILKDL